jgi:hypothetical protein
MTNRDFKRQVADLSGSSKEQSAAVNAAMTERDALRKQIAQLQEVLL